MRTALIHEWFTNEGGAEKVTDEILKILNDEVTIFSLLNYSRKSVNNYSHPKNKIRVSYLQYLTSKNFNYRLLLPLFPMAIRQYDLRTYDLVISSSHSFAKGVRKFPNQIHVCYCHSTMRYVWDLHKLYLKINNLNNGLSRLLSESLRLYLRRWDFNSSKNVDYFIANSNYTAGKIKKNYHRDSVVIYPPINLRKFNIQTKKEEYYLAASRLVSYKRTDLIVKAFSNMPNKKLIVIGEGPFLDNLKKILSPNIQLLGYQHFDKFHYYLRSAKAFVHAAQEDFGMVLVEALACGTPVIAFKKGGAKEIIKNFETGCFFKQQTVESIIEAINLFEEVESKFDSGYLRNSVRKFSSDQFMTEFKNFIGGLVPNHENLFS